MIKVFISQPMRGKSEEEILLVRKIMERLIQEKLSGCCEIVDSYFEDYPEAESYKNIGLKYLAKSLDKLADADVFLRFNDCNARFSRGCMIEQDCAHECGLIIHCVANKDILKYATEEEVKILQYYWPCSTNNVSLDETQGD